jgi:hypothetical protein
MCSYSDFEQAERDIVGVANLHKLELLTVNFSFAGPAVPLPERSPRCKSDNSHDLVHIMITMRARSWYFMTSP